MDWCVVLAVWKGLRVTVSCSPLLTEQVAALSSTVRHFLVSQSQFLEHPASRLHPHFHSLVPKNTHPYARWRSPGLAWPKWRRRYVHFMYKQVIHRTTVATSSTRLSSNNACHCKALWLSAGNELTIHYTWTITCTRQQQQHTIDAKFTFTLPSTNATVCYRERRRWRLRNKFTDYLRY